MQELTHILGVATAAIESMYFRLHIDGGDPIYRERVYCYELYHQLRLRWPIECPYYINGEVDKAAHPILAGLGADYAKPDFLIHQPGYMSGNHAIIEVKHTRTRFAGVRKDLSTLALFRARVGYQRAIYLIFGEEHEIADRIRSAAAAMPDLPPIELWLHPDAGTPAFQFATVGH